MTYVLSDDDRKVWACRTADVDEHLALIKERYPDRVAEMVAAQVAAAKPIYDHYMATGGYTTYAEVKAERDARNAAFEKAGTDAGVAKYTAVKAAGLAEAGDDPAKIAILEQAALSAARTADAEARQAWKEANA